MKKVWSGFFLFRILLYIRSVIEKQPKMNTVSFKSNTFTVSQHAVERIQYRFEGINLQDAISRGKMVDRQNACKFGKVIENKINTMSMKYSSSARLIVNSFYNACFAVDVNTKVVITAMYLDGTWSE